MRKLSSRQYAQTLLELVESTPREKWDELFDAFLAILRKRRALRLLPLVLDALDAIEHEQRGVVPVKLTTSRTLPAAGRQSVHEALEAAIGQSVELSTGIDPQIVGGAVVEYKDHRLDGSLRTRVERLSRQLSQST